MTFRTRQLVASGEAVGLPDGQMGNSEVGHLTIGSGRIGCTRTSMRVNKAIEDGSFFENPVLRGAFERGKHVHLLGLVSHGGVHSHIDHLQALLEFAPEKTWIHAFTDGRDVSPHSAIARPRRAARRPHRDGRRPLLRDGSRQALGSDTASARRDVEREVRPTAERRDEGATSYDAGVTDEFIEPIVVEGRPGIEPATTRRSSSTSGPTARGSCREMLVEHGRRPDDDDALPRRASRSRPRSTSDVVAETLAEVLPSTASASSTSPRPRSTRT